MVFWCFVIVYVTLRSSQRSPSTHSKACSEAAAVMLSQKAIHAATAVAAVVAVVVIVVVVVVAVVVVVDSSCAITGRWR